jgi:hypothetical protein
MSVKALCFVFLIAKSYQFSPIRQAKQDRHLSLFSTVEDTLTIREAIRDELPRCAGFLSQSMYATTIPAGQARELARLELNDLRDRYGELVGKRKYPSIFFIALKEEEIIGSVGIDCQYYDEDFMKFRPIKRNREIDESRKIVVVLANLAVRIDKR